MATELVACVVAEGVSADSMTGRLTAFNMLEVVFTRKLPALLPKLFVVTIYETEGAPEHFHERITVFDPDDKVVVSSCSQIAATEHTHRSINALWGMRLERLGRYLVRVERANKPGGPWKQIGKRVLTVVADGHPLFPEEERGAKETVASSSPVAEVE